MVDFPVSVAQTTCLGNFFALWPNNHRMNKVTLQPLQEVLLEPSMPPVTHKNLKEINIYAQFRRFHNKPPLDSQHYHHLGGSMLLPGRASWLSFWAVIAFDFIPLPGSNPPTAHYTHSAKPITHAHNGINCSCWQCWCYFSTDGICSYPILCLSGVFAYFSANLVC